MEYILPYLVFNIWEIVGLTLFFLFFCIQVRFYIIYYRKPYNYANRVTNYEAQQVKHTPKVSVVIEAENESKRLAEHLPLILNQNYPDFEVIVVNKGSTDETYELLQSLSLKYPNLYHTYIPEAYDRSTRKLALTVGIKAAKGDVILVTESYARPISTDWIRLMVKDLYGGKEVSLGYSFFATDGSTGFNRLARFDNLICSLQYLSRAIKGKPYYGTYRNIAFKKSLFFDNKGFATYLGKDGGEELFVHQIVNEQNTVVTLDQDAFIESELDGHSLWEQIRKTYSNVKKNLGVAATRLFPFEAFSRYIFHALFVALVVSGSLNSNWVLLGLVGLLWFVREINQYIIIRKAGRYFKAGEFRFSLLFLEMVLPIYKVRFRRKSKRK